MTKDDSRAVLCWINMFGLTYFWSTVVVFFSVTTFVYIPTIYEKDQKALNSQTYMSYFVMVEVLVNYFLCIIKNSYFDPEKCAAIPNSTWGRCLDCDAPKPPRTHHCPSCKRCVLKRDHHCFLTASCIGFMNLRYMIVYCLYSALASGYTLYMAHVYIAKAYEPIAWTNWHHFVMPFSIIECLFGLKTVRFVFHVSMLYWAAITMLCGAGMGFLQLLFAIFHLTQRDIHQGRSPNFTRVPAVCEELRRIFGPWFLLNFIFPLFWLSPKGDGVHLTDSDAEKLI